MQARAGTQCQRTGIDEGATGIGIGTVQGQRCRALLGQRAGATQAAVEGEVVAAEYGQPGVEDEVVGQRHRSVRIERTVATHRYRPGAQSGIVADHQAACIERYTATEGAGAVEGLHACAVLDEATITGDRTVERAVYRAAQGQRTAPQRHGAAGHTGKRTDALVARRDIEGTGTGQVHRTGRGQAATSTDGQRAAVDGGASGVGIRTAQGHGGRTVLDQPTGTGNDAAQGQCIAAQQVEVGT